MNTQCHNLDAYLADGLAVDAAAMFEEHLERCDECREQITEQRWIDTLLQSPDAQRLEVAPPHVLEIVKTTVAADGRMRRRWVASAFAAAAVVLLALGWIQFKQQQSGNDTAAIQPVNSATEPPAPPSATFVADENAIAVPMASKHSNVTIVRVYPTLRSNLADQVTRIEPNDETEFTADQFSTGG